MKLEEIKYDVQFVTGQIHYQNRGNKEDLQSAAARAGWERAKAFRAKIELEKLVNKKPPLLKGRSAGG